MGRTHHVSWTYRCDQPGAFGPPFGCRRVRVVLAEELDRLATSAVAANEVVRSEGWSLGVPDCYGPVRVLCPDHAGGAS